jgi:tetratricopeptide (TPR) repeat protein
LKSQVLAEPVLVGRERELHELEHFLEIASEGKGRTVFISAEAGMGKTRLVKEFLELVKQEKNIVTLSGWCLFNAGVPYFPFIEAFSNYYSVAGRKSEKEELELNSWLKGPATTTLTGQLNYLSPQALKDQTFIAVGKTIHHIATQNPIILLLEDIHWADSASLALIHYIARAINNSEKVLLLATFRNEELTSDPEGYPHKLVQTLSMMRREDLFNEIKLSSLDRACVLKMAESMLDGTLQQSLAEKLAVKSEGNPLFVVESLRMLYQQENLVLKNDKWRLSLEELEIPSKIKDIIIQRLAYLNSAQRRILDVASVIGDEFQVGLLSAIVDQDSLEVLEKLNEIFQLTSIICFDEDRFRFDHARSRETIYGEIAKPLRQGYHNKVAEKLEGLKNIMLPLRDLAYHYAQAANKEKAIRYALAAGQDELARWSSTEAIEHFTYVLQAIRQDPERTSDTEKALEGLGDAFYANSMFKEASRIFEELGDTAKTSAVKLRAFRKATESAFQHGDPDQMLELLNKAKPYTAADHLENARLLAGRSRALMLQSKPDCIKDLEDALQVFEEEYSLWDVAWALMGVGNFHVAWRGKEHQGLAETLRSIAMFEGLGDFRSQMETYFVAGYNFMVCQLNKEALDVYAKIIAIDENMKMGDYFHACNAYAWSGSLLSFYIGDLEKGLSYSLKALELSKKTDSLVVQGVVYSNLVRIYAFLGDVGHAEEHFEKLAKLPQDIFNFYSVNGEFARAILQAAKGHWTIFEELFAKLKAAHAPGWSEAAEGYYAWILERQGRLEEAQAQREKAKKSLREAEERFEHANIQASLMVHRQVVVDEPFEMRLDLANVSRTLNTVAKVEITVPPELKINSMPSCCKLKESCVQIQERGIGPFHLETITLSAVIMREGAYKLEALVTYSDELSDTKKTKVGPIAITVQPSSLESIEERFSEFTTQKLTLRSEAARKIINYLVCAFEEDYIKRRLTEERSGWRTLMNVVKNAQVSKHSIYGRSGRGGKVMSELKASGLLEIRVFQGEVGRGGHVVKIRISQNIEIQPVLRKLLDTQKL